MPHHIVIGKGPPSMGDLRSTAEGGSVEVAKDFERELGGKSGEEVDTDEFADTSRDEGQLGEAALRQDALQHQLALLSRGGGEERPYMSNALLVILGEGFQFLDVIVSDEDSGAIRDTYSL
jgi:hypothetical protein